MTKQLHIWLTMMDILLVVTIISSFYKPYKPTCSLTKQKSSLIESAISLAGSQAHQKKQPGEGFRWK